MSDFLLPNTKDQKTSNMLLNNPNVTTLFASNPPLVHSKVRPYPIGVNGTPKWIGVGGHLNGSEALLENRTTLFECHGVANNFGRQDKFQALGAYGFTCGNRLEQGARTTNRAGPSPEARGPARFFGKKYQKPAL